MIIAIDGPAGAGKSTVARRVAQALGLTYLDTGAMYRALTLGVLRRGLDPGSEQDCGLVAQSIQLSFDPEGRVQIDGEVAEPAIRSERVTASVSTVSAFSAVRAAVVREQRALAANVAGLVAEGRDTTTVVFPDAAHKFFLIATPAERARRRSVQLGQPTRQDEIRAEIERRDALDSTRDLSPLVCAEDAEVIDTTGIGVEQVIERMLASVRPRPDAVSSNAADHSLAPEVLTEATLTYSVVRAAMVAWYAPYFRPRIEARANLPATGGVLLVCNHQSFLDIPLVAIACSRHVSFVARDSLARSRVLAHVMRQCGAVLIRRGTADRAALREMVEHLRRGDSLCMFPEGTRTSDGRLQPMRAGALLAARKADVPILPVGIRGTFDAWSRRHRLPRPRRVGLRFGKPVDSADPDALKRVRFQIQAMIGDGHFGSVAPL